MKTANFEEEGGGLLHVVNVDRTVETIGKYKNINFFFSNLRKFRSPANEFLLQSCAHKLCYKALQHVENLFIQRFLFIHPRFAFIVQGLLMIVQ